MEHENITCVVTGAAGRMGRRLCSLIETSPNHVLAGATEHPHSEHAGDTLQDATGIPRRDIVIADSLDAVAADFEVVIDFTFPEVSMETVRFAAARRVPAVVGTTGFSEEQRSEIQHLSRSFPCVCAPNMSMGVNALFKLVAEAAGVLREGFDAEIMEIHHRHKKDAPSGTAVRLAEIIADKYGRDLAAVGVFGRKGFIGERSCEEIGVQTMRAGDIVGEHTVLFGGAGERIELVHRAQSRDCFAQGALRAARWIVGRPDGLYDMQDVLGLR